MTEIKDRLAEALRIREMTAAELSRKSGIDKGSISNYLKGKFMPKQSAIGAMAEALHVLPSWLMGYDVPMEAALPDKPDFILKYEMLSEKDKEQVNSYIEFLIETHKEN